MTGENSLFRDFVFLLIVSDEFPQNEADIICEKLKNGGAQRVLMKRDHDTSQVYISDQENKEGITHIITKSTDFQESTVAEESMIPLITHEWVDDCVTEGKLITTKPYNPDPRFFFSDIFISVANLPEGDKEAICGGVKALGGQFMDQLTRFTTHLIALDMSDDKCIIAQSTNSQINIKIVLPHWIDDCLKLRRRIDETPYLLPRPKILSKDYKDKNSFDGQPNSELDIGPNHNSQLLVQQLELPKFLNSKKIFISDDLELSERGLSTFSSLIENIGGRVVPEPVEINASNTDIYIGKYRDGSNFKRASKYNILIGSLDWIYWMVAHNKWILPTKKLLHYPIVRNGHPEFRSLSISATNYTGDARNYLARLVESLGGEFTKTLRPNNTHLICAKPTGKKYDAALKWGVKTLNHLWLEESYSKWMKQDETHPRYLHYANSVNLETIIGKTELDLNVLKAWYAGEFDILDNSDSKLSHQLDIADGVLETDKKFEVSKEQAKVKTLKRDSSVINSLPEDATPKRTKAAEADTNTPDLKEWTDIPSSTSRKAKDKAAAKLHSDMVDLNYYQQQIKSKSKNTPMLPSEIENVKREKELIKKKKEQESSIVEDDSETKKDKLMKDTGVQNTKKKPKKTKSASPGLTNFDESYSINAITTGCDELSKNELQLLSSVGITIELKDPAKATHIVAPRVMRTEKFLVALSAGPQSILHPTFLTDILSHLQKTPDMQFHELSNSVSVANYELDKIDKKANYDMKIPIKRLLSISQKRASSNDLLFKDMTFNVSSDIPGGSVVVTRILTSHGARKTKAVKSVSGLKSLISYSENDDTNKTVIFITKKNTNPKQTFQIKKIFKDNVAEGVVGNVVDWEWVVKSILTMNLEKFDDYLV